METTIRQARESDRTQIDGLFGADAVPQGDCYVAINGDRVVGTLTLIRLGEDEWWLDALRVQPGLQDQGIEYAPNQSLVQNPYQNLYQYAVQRAEAQSSSGMVRFAAQARTMNKLAAQTQFSLVGSYVLYQTDVLPGLASEFAPARDLAAVRAFLDSSPYYVQAQGSLEDTGIWYALNGERLQAYLAQSRVFSWYGLRHDPSAPDGVIIFAANSAPPLLRLAYLDAAVGALADLCRAVRRFAGAQGYKRIQHRFLVRPERLVAIEQAGWRPPGGGSDERDLFSRPLGITPERLIDL